MLAQWFEALGVRGLYLIVSRLVREDPLPSTRGSVPDLSQQAVSDTRKASLYFSSANIARMLCYVPQAIAFGLSGYRPGLVTVTVIAVMHVLLVVVEAYKRALCDHWILKLPDREGHTPPPPLTRPRGPFRLRTFESERFYRLIGMEFFRKFVTWVMSVLTHGPGGKRMTFISNPGRSQAVAFEHATRVSETVHWCSAATVAPLVVFSWIGAPLGVAVWSTVIIWGDVMLALLQRFHRVRVWPLIQKMLERAG